GNEDHEISLDTASEWNARFRATIGSSDPDQTISHFFGKEYLLSILNQTDCVGLRIYHALDSDNNRHLVICGAKANEDDLYLGVLAEHALKGPLFGGMSNPLNS